MKKLKAKIKPQMADTLRSLYHGECERCGKEISFFKADIAYGAYGCPMVNCPRCPI